MSEIFDFFDPISVDTLGGHSLHTEPSTIGSTVLMNKENAPLDKNSKFELALIGVCDYQGIERQPSFLAANQIRQQLYRLQHVSPKMRIADLGNLKAGKTQTDSLFALQEVCALLFAKKTTVIIMGGTQLFTLGQFRAFKEYENDLNMVVIDSHLDMNPDEAILDHRNFLHELIEKDASHLYNISLVGYQSYFIDYKNIEILNRNYFEHYRLGQVRSHFEDMEAVLRDADLVSFDLSAIRMCDAPGQEEPSPNGFYAEEASSLARYAGISDRNRSFAVYGYHPEFDNRQQTAKNIAQMIWYYLEGFHLRKHDFPVARLEDYTKYSVSIDEIDFPIVFYKSDKSQRWWLEVANLEKNEEKYTKVVVACTDEDYQKACRNEIPERWWINFKKLR